MAVGRLIGGCLTGEFPSLSLTGQLLDFVEFGLRGKFLGLPRGWTILDAAYRFGFLSVVSWQQVSSAEATGDVLSSESVRRLVR